MKLVFFSLTGQTRRFVQKTGLESAEILPDDDLTMNEDFLLITPSYAEENPTDMSSQDVVQPVFDFLSNAENAKFCRGIIGTGNRNFADLYIYTAKELSAKHQIPILYDFEFSGLPSDVEKVCQIATALDNGQKIIRQI